MPASWAALTRFGDDLARAIGERGEDAAGVQPADASSLKSFFQSIIAGLHAGGGGVAAVVEGDAGALAGADFGEVQADAVLLGRRRRTSRSTTWLMSMPTARA